MDIVTISEEARVKAIALREAEGRAADAVLRVGVQGGGCSGFQYLLEYDERRDDDLVLELDGPDGRDRSRSRLRCSPARCWSTTAAWAARASSSATRRSRPAAAAAAPSRSTRTRSRRWASHVRRGGVNGSGRWLAARLNGALCQVALTACAIWPHALATRLNSPTPLI